MLHQYLLPFYIYAVNILVLFIGYITLGSDNDIVGRLGESNVLIILVLIVIGDIFAIVFSATKLASVSKKYNKVVLILGLILNIIAALVHVALIFLGITQLEFLYLY